MSIKKNISELAVNPKQSFEEIFNTLDTNNDSIAKLSSALFACSLTDETKLFLEIAESITNHKDFMNRLDVQYFYNISSGLHHRYLGDWPTSLDFYMTAYKISCIMDDSELVIKAAVHLSGAFEMTGDSENAVFYSEQAISKLEGIDDIKILADTYHSFGVVLLNNQEYQRALPVFEKSIEYHRKNDGYEKTLNYCMLQFSCGACLFRLKEIEKASEKYEYGLELSKKQGFNDYIKGNLRTYSELLAQNGNWKKAYDTLKIFSDYSFRNPESPKTASAKLKNKSEIAALNLLRERNSKLKKRIKNLSKRYISREMTVKKQLQIMDDIHDAILSDSYVPFYQPKWSLKNSCMTGVEVLVRWKQGDEIITPDTFIPLIEENYMIHEISALTIKKSFQFSKQLVERFGRNFQISINITPYQFTHHNVARLIEQECIIAGFSPENVVIEVTERSFLINNSQVELQLNELKAMGVKIALDDFGIGYSSLSMLNNFDFDILKIDRSLLIDAPKSSKAATILKTIILSARLLKIHTVIEGVENTEQIELLRKLKCDDVQGYYFGKPMPEEKLQRFISETSQNG